MDYSSLLRKTPFLQLLFVGVLMGLLVAGCKDEQHYQRNNQSQIVNKEGAAVVQGRIRISGNTPYLNGNKLIFSSIEVTQNSTELIYSYKKSNDEQNLDLKIKQLTGQNILLYYLSFPQKNIDGSEFIGIFFDSIPGMQQGIALNRYPPVRAWTRPVIFSQIQQMDSVDNTFVYWQYTDSLYAVVFPLSGNGFVGDLGRNGDLFGVRAYSKVNHHRVEGNIPLLAIAFGYNFYETVQNLSAEVVREIKQVENLRKKKQFPAIFENLGWCTWNAFNHNITEEKILNGVKSFKEKNIPLGFVLIDDGWLSTDDNKLNVFQPDKTKFPNGLKPLVDRIKAEYASVDVGVWHTLNGYWEGIKPGSEISKAYTMHSYRDQIVWLKDSLSDMIVPSPADGSLRSFYADWYSYLKGEGISLVKVDNQNVVNEFANQNLSFFDAGFRSEKALQDAASNYFEGNIINCMDMSVNTLYNFGKSAVARASEDYFPADINTNYDLKFSCNAAGHILMCHFNSIWFSNFVYPDYDMFQTHRDDAEYHAIARVISGGPIYLTDIPGQQNAEIIHKMILSDGTILRADQPSLPTEDCLFQLEGGKPFKAFSKEGNAGLLAAWNASDTSLVSGTIRPADVPGLIGDSFVVYEHFSGEFKILTQYQEDSIEIARMDQKLFIIIPVEKDITPIGLLEKYNSSATIESVVYLDDKCKIKLFQGGLFGAYCKTKPQEVSVNQQEIDNEKTIWNNGLLQIKTENYQSDCEIEIVK